jgi:tetratricopeptide (TPR) repeat protein
MSGPGARAIAMALLAALVVAGCDDAGLWSRYRAERLFWRARRQVDRLQLNPRFVNDGDYDRAAAAFRRVTHRFPAAEWTRPERLSMRYARDVATLSGRSVIGLARIAEMRGRTEEAIAGYTDALESYHAVPEVALEASIARARALERSGRMSAANVAWLDLWTRFAMVDSATGDPMLAVLDAPLRVARQLAGEGRHEAADSVLSAASLRYETALAHHTGRRAAPELWSRLAEARAELGDTDGALWALRSALHEPAARDLAPRLVLGMAERALQGGKPDSALAYARWAETGFRGRLRQEALMLEGRIFEAAARPESALAVYDTFISDYPKSMDAVASARFRRGVIYENLGHWQQARTEYRALVAGHPTHELSFEALERIVAWHLAKGEDELARIEGRRGIESLEHVLATQHDDDVQMLARRGRADLLDRVGDPAEACDALTDVWKRYPDTPAGVAAAIRAAQIAETRLYEPSRALELYEELAGHAGNPDTQRAARAAAERLRRRSG